MSRRDEILRELKARASAGTLTEGELEKFRPLISQAVSEQRSRATPEATDEAVEEEAQAGGFDPVRELTSIITGDATLQDAAVKDAGREFKDVDARVKELEAIPELWQKQVGGGHQTNVGRAFLDSIGYLGLEGDDKILSDMRSRIDTISKASGSLNNPGNLRKLIDSELKGYNVETEQMGDAILINFDDPISGERHVTWANKPGFSGRDAISLMETTFEGASLLGAGGVIRGGTRMAREFAKRRAWRNARPVRDPATGRMVRNPKKVRAEERAAAKAERQAAKAADPSRLSAKEIAAAETVGITTTGLPGVGTATAKTLKGIFRGNGAVANVARTAAEEAAFSRGGLVASEAVGKMVSGRGAGEALRSGLRARSKIKRRDRALKQRR